MVGVRRGILAMICRLRKCINFRLLAHTLYDWGAPKERILILWGVQESFVLVIKMDCTSGEYLSGQNFPAGTSVRLAIFFLSEKLAMRTHKN